ncbi:hypothetical protein AGMMS49975_04140 [Clostridia bacterium]|nr:hypothetical protein AGMMS49975_04140 [Clostridia bacterium]
MPTETLTAERPKTVRTFTSKLTERPEEGLTLDEKIIRAIALCNIPVRELDVDENGHIIVDKDKDPDLYDWAVNG